MAGRSGITDFFPRRFDPAAPGLAFYAFHPGGHGGPGRGALFFRDGGATDDSGQTFQGIRAVFFLGPILLRLDDENPLAA